MFSIVFDSALTPGDQEISSWVFCGLTITFVTGLGQIIFGETSTSEFLITEENSAAGIIGATKSPDKNSGVGVGVGVNSGVGVGVGVGVTSGVGVGSGVGARISGLGLGEVSGFSIRVSVGVGVGLGLT